MIVTLFSSRLRAGMTEEELEVYQADNADIFAQAQAMPGFVSARSYLAEDGERLTVVQFDTKDNHLRWRDHTEHRKAQQRGRERYYDEYRILVCESDRDHSWQRDKN